MAIVTTITDSGLTLEGFQVFVETTNDAFPGETSKFTRVYDDAAMTAAQIKQAVLDATTLYWQARANQGVPL